MNLGITPNLTTSNYGTNAVKQNQLKQQNFGAACPTDPKLIEKMKKLPFVGKKFMATVEKLRNTIADRYVVWINPDSIRVAENEMDTVLKLNIKKGFGSSLRLISTLKRLPELLGAEVVKKR